tara:strand:- start:1164 stop:1676 length:513 start_codon:yes stop_codon:yes gene_type:complete
MILWNYLKLNVLINRELKLNSLLLVSFLILIFLQIIVGAFVSGMDAGLIYNSWPLMGKTYFPDDNEIFNLFDTSVFNDPSLVQFLHRNLAYIILLSYLILLFKVYKNKIKNSYFAINSVGILLFIQIILGILTLINGVELILASLHQISSIFLISASIYLLYINKKVNLM